jgi:hypothetical protein
MRTSKGTDSLHQTQVDTLAQFHDSESIRFREASCLGAGGFRMIDWLVKSHTGTPHTAHERLGSQ